MVAFLERVRLHSDCNTVLNGRAPKKGHNYQVSGYTVLKQYLIPQEFSFFSTASNFWSSLLSEIRQESVTLKICLFFLQQTSPNTMIFSLWNLLYYHHTIFSPREYCNVVIIQGQDEDI